MRMDTFTAFLVKRGRVVLALTALLMATAILGITRLNIKTEFDIFMPPDSGYTTAMDTMSASFGDSDQVVVLAEIGFDESRLQALPGIVERITDIPGVATAQSPISRAIIEMEPGDRQAALDQLKELAGSTALVERDGTQYTLIRVLLENLTRVNTTMQEIQEVFKDHGIPIVISGEPYLQSQIFTYILRIIVTIPPVAILLMLLVFRIRIGSFRATALSMVPAIVGAAVTLGAIAWFQGSVSMVSVLVPVFVIVLGSADGLHITSHVMDALASGKTNEEAVATTLKAVGVPVIMTSLTTMAGFLSLMVINSSAIRELGVTAAIGIGIAGAAPWPILPTILLHQKPLSGSRNREEGTAFRLLARLRGWPSVAIALAIVVAFVPGVLQLRSGLSMIDVYRPGTEVRKSIAAAQEILGGSIPVYLTFPAEDAFSPELANAVLAVQDAATVEGVA
ncbi:MAG: hypothetical protein E4H09_04340, partial [Spirochaetales bacterium]